MGKNWNHFKNSCGNGKRNAQCAFHQYAIKPWRNLNIYIRGRQSALDDWHRKQKAQFKKLFIKAFEQEQVDLLKKERENKENELKNEQKSEKEIHRIVKSLKKQKWTQDGQVTISYFLQQVDEFVEKEALKSVRRTACCGLISKANQDHDLCFVRDGKKIRILSQDPFFQFNRECSDKISWNEFKNNVFYKYVEQHDRFLLGCIRVKHIMEVIERAWSQLRQENPKSDITYDQMKMRLLSFKHTLPSAFFAESFWLQKGDQPIQDLTNNFIRQDCRISCSYGDVCQMILDLDNEQVPNNGFTDNTVSLGIQSLKEDNII